MEHYLISSVDYTLARFVVNSCVKAALACLVCLEQYLFFQRLKMRQLA